VGPGPAAGPPPRVRVGPSAPRRGRLARLETLLVEVADYKVRQRARLRHAEQRAEAARQAYRRRLEAIVAALGTRLPADLVAELRSEELLYVFGDAEFVLLDRLRAWRDRSRQRSRAAPA
jgi:hypothetical protein